MELSRYSLDLIREDGEFTLYRAHSKRLEPSPVLLLTPSSTRPTPETLGKIDHEFSLRSELDKTWALRPIEISSLNHKRALVLEDPGGMPLNRVVGGPTEMQHFLRLAVVISNAVGRLHGRGLIHKDLKPANVFIAPDAGQVWLTGFGIASRLAREQQPPEPPEFIAGTLAYMAPEQTGRMNRSIDSRSDLYALGVTLYEVLTGSLPFTASDPMEWVHCHIAREPIPPAGRAPNIPGPISAIIMKLLAKTAEERYQTALGVERDLRRCLDDWETHKRIDEFPLGEHDTPDRLLIREKLYGREKEIESLLTSFDRVVAGERPELVLVSGYSGIGKSSVVNELHKSLVPPRGLFASGKFDQYKRDIPYSTLAQAFQSLLRPLLTKSEAELHKWREALQEALGPNGQLIIDLVPVLKLIIGEQPPVPELPPQDAQGRFQLVFRRFINVFARPEHPLALFLDDLQWLDAATLDLIEDLLTQSDLRWLMLIGAYRDNEVDSSHPLMRKLEAIRKAGGTVQEIVLAPLTREDLARLIMDSFHCESERGTPLAELIREKTAGNPFFSIQFIFALTEEELVRFDYGQGLWTWDLNSIRAKGYADNVVDLMVGKLNRLSSKTQTTLQLLACLGNRADFDVLELAFQDPMEEMHQRLWEAILAGLIIRTDHAYQFLHDRVQEAAYSLIQEESRAEAHLRIGRLLFARTPPEKREDRIFEIVNQFNRGASLITSPGECERVAELNLIAGKRAQASTAYASALAFFTAGTSLLLDSSWEQMHELMFELELHRAECEFLTGQLAAAEERLMVLSSRAANTVERATVTCLRADLYTTLDESNRAVTVCLEYLRHVDIEWTAHPTEEEARRQYDRIWSQLGTRPIEQVIELPIMNDPASLATLDVLTKVLIPALFTDANLLSLAVCTAVNLSLELGNSDASCVAYVWLGQIAGPHFGSYEAGFRFGELGYELVERRGLKRFEARTLMVFGHHVIPWTKHVRAGRNLLRRAFETANKIGDLTFAAYSSINLITNLLIAGDPLAEVQQEAMNGLQYAQKIRFGFAFDHIRSQLGLICTLRGLTPKFGSFNVDQFDELQFESHLASDPALAQSECYYWIRKLQARFLAGDYASALDSSLRAQRLLWSAPSNLERAEYEFYSALAHTASWDSAPSDERQQHFDALSAHSRQLDIWAEHCPDNFENRAALVAAEIARIEGRLLDAEHLYENAIRSARTNGFIHNEAIAHEIAARFYLTRGFEKIAYAYLRDARYGYSRWGATAKVQQLDDLYPHLPEEKPMPESTSMIGAPIEQLDLGTVIKVSQAVSAEMDLDKLIDTVMSAAIEHAGAARGLLILSRSDGQYIEAEATTIGDKILVRREEAARCAVPQSIVNYVARTHDFVILDDASSQNRFAADTYFSQHHARSVLCLPLITQAQLVGLVYLENSLAPNVFTPNRIAVLKLLASQAAISVQNAHLYADLKKREAKIRRLVEANVVGVVMWTLDGAIVEANEAFLHMVQYSHEDIASGRVRWTDLTPAEWSDRDERAVTELRATGICQPFEKEYFRKDGSRVPVLVAGVLFENGGSEGVAFALDLSEQKRVEEALRRSEAYLSEAQKLSRTGSWRWNIGTGEVIWSQEFFAIFGFDSEKDKASYQLYVERIHPEDRSNVEEARGVAIRERQHFEAEYRLLLPGGLIKYLHSTGHCLVDQSGEVEYIGAVMDISERKRAEEERERLRQAQRIVVQTATDAVFSADESGAIQFANPATMRIFGYDPKELIGKPLTVLMPEYMRKLHEDGFRRYLATGQRHLNWQGTELTGLRKNGQEFPVEVSFGELTMSRHRVFTAFIRDITERKQAEQERERLRRTQAELAHMNRVSTLGELTASLAHEIKQPIGAAVTNAAACVRLLDGDEPDIPDAREAALEMVKDARRAADIIDRVRSLYQKVSSELGAVDVNETIREMVVMLQNEANRHSVTIHTDLAAGLPKAMADRVQLQQVLMNLMLNGIEAMRDASGELGIKSQVADDGQLLISVADTGVGLPAENADRIFDAFFTTKPQGTGLGLAITRSIVKAHGGRIWATSNSGRGATFKFTLPSTLAAAA